jgi:hypothetical protein
MIIGVLYVEVYLPNSHSLKDKRRIIKGLVRRLQQRHNLSVAILDGQDFWQRCTLGIAQISSKKSLADRSLNEAERMIEATNGLVVTQVEKAYLVPEGLD